MTQTVAYVATTVYGKALWLCGVQRVRATNYYIHYIQRNHISEGCTRQKCVCVGGGGGGGGGRMRVVFGLLLKMCLWAGWDVRVTSLWC